MKLSGSEEMLPAGTKDESHRRHLSTDHLLADLKGRTVSGTFVTIVAQGAQLVLSLVSIVVLARLLTPSDFGLFAMVATLVGYLRVFKDAGLSTATVQREGITQAQVSNLFWINVGLGGLITILLAASAPLVAWFYREPRLVGITLTLSATFILNSLAVQHNALLNRQMRFTALGIIQVGSTLIGVALGITMALLKFDYWALVISNLVTVFMATLFTWMAIPWRPHAPSRGSETWSLVRFGANMATGGLVYSFARGADVMLIGRYGGAIPLGFYSRGTALLTRPMDQLLSPIGSVFLPVLSRLQAQPERYRRNFLRVYETMALTSCLCTGLLFALARPLTLVVLGPKWGEVAMIFAGFSVAAFCMPLSAAATWLFASQGRGRDSFLAALIISVIVVASFTAGLPLGPTGVAISYSASCLVLQLPILYWLAGRSGPVSSSDLWISFLRQLPVWGIVCAVTWLAHRAIPDDQPLKELVIAAPSGLLAGAAFIVAYPPARRVVVDLLSIVHGLKKAA